MSFIFSNSQNNLFILGDRKKCQVELDKLNQIQSIVETLEEDASSLLSELTIMKERIQEKLELIGPATQAGERFLKLIFDKVT